MNIQSELQTPTGSRLDALFMQQRQIDYTPITLPPSGDEDLSDSLLIPTS